MSFGNMRRSPQQDSDDFAGCVNGFFYLFCGGWVVAGIVAVLKIAGVL